MKRIWKYIMCLILIFGCENKTDQILYGKILDGLDDLKSEFSDYQLHADESRPLVAKKGRSGEKVSL